MALVQITCAHCGTGFDRYRSVAQINEDRGYENYCSKRCRSLGKRLDPKTPAAGHIAVRLSGEQREFIVSTADREGVSYGEIIRRCVDAMMFAGSTDPTP